MQAAHCQQETALPRPHDGPAASRPHVPPFENGRQVALQSEKGPGPAEQGQRDPVGSSPEPAGQSTILQQRHEDRERCRLGRHQEEVPGAHGQRARQGAREGGQGQRGRARGGAEQRRGRGQQFVCRPRTLLESAHLVGALSVRLDTLLSRA